LKKEFDFTPKIAWNVDPFGHSSAYAKLLLDMGFEALFFGRMNDYEREARAKNKELEFYWRP